MTEGWIPAFAGMTKKGTGMTDEDFTPTLILPPQGEKQYRVYSIEYIVRKKQRKRWIPAPRFHEDRFRLPVQARQTGGNDPGRARLIRGRHKKKRVG